MENKTEKEGKVMSIGEWHNEDKYEPPRWFGVEPGRLIAAVFFGLFVTGVALLVGWFLITSPNKVELHQVDGNTYICRYYSDDIKCELYGDPDIGFGRVNP